MVDRVSTLAQNSSTLRDAVRVQTELARLQTQLSSGLKSPNFQGIASQTEQFLSLENKISRARLYQDNNRVVQTRIDTTNSSLDQIITTGTNIKNLILQRRNVTSGLSGAVFVQQLEGLWKSVTQSLNLNVEGRYLFSGDRTNTPAVDSDSFPTLIETGVPDDGYYTGGSQDLSVQVDESVSMTYNVRANAPGFQKLFAGMAMAKQGDAQGSDELLSQAFSLIESGIADVISIQATVNSNKVTVDQINQRQQGLQVYWTGLKEEIGNADLVTASTQVAINQGILQASFQTFARITSLRLSDYLRN